MKNNSFFFELIKSPPFLALIVLALFIAVGVMISKCKEKNVQMKEDIIYIQPRPKL